MSKVYAGKKVVSGVVRGEVLVSPEPLCFLGGVDPETGIVVEKGHPLEGRSMRGKVLIFPIGRGSTGGSYLIYETAANGNGPCAVVNLKPDPVTVVGCIMAQIPMVVYVDEELLKTAKDGDIAEVDGEAGTVVLYPKI